MMFTTHMRQCSLHGTYSGRRCFECSREFDCARAEAEKRLARERLERAAASSEGLRTAERRKAMGGQP